MFDEFEETDKTIRQLYAKYLTSRDSFRYDRKNLHRYRSPQCGQDSVYICLIHRG